MQEKLSIEYNGKMLVLTVDSFGDNIDIPSLTKIDVNSLLEETVTSPSLLNQAGNMLADCQYHRDMIKLDNKILYANLWTMKAQELAEGPKKPTQNDIENAVIASDEYRLMEERLLKTDKELDYIKSLYWSIKDKCDKLNKLIDNVNPNSFNPEIVEKKLNNVTLQVKEKIFK